MFYCVNKFIAYNNDKSNMGAWREGGGELFRSLYKDFIFIIITEIISQFVCTITGRSERNVQDES